MNISKKLIVSNKYTLSLLFVYHLVMGYLNGFDYYYTLIDVWWELILIKENKKKKKKRSHCAFFSLFIMLIEIYFNGLHYYYVFDWRLVVIKSK